MGIKKKRLIPSLLIVIFITGVMEPVSGNTLLREFKFSLPLFAMDSAWNQTSDSASVVSNSPAQILTLYRVLRGDVSQQYPATNTPATTWPFMDINYDSYSIAVFLAGSGQQDVYMRDYEGVKSGNTDKLPTGTTGTIHVPSCFSTVRPAGPQDIDADGHLVLFDSSTHLEYDFWQATTLIDTQGNSMGGGREGDAVLEAGAIDVFDTRGPGINPKGNSSARATGVPLLAGLILPEDFENGKIAHALAVAVPGPRNTSGSDPSHPSEDDYFYPVSTTETDFYSQDESAPAAGQRLRLKQTIVDDTGAILDETALSPATRLFLQALRDYGALIVDNAGGFSFYAEDIHSANLNLTDDQVNTMIGEPIGTPIPQGKTKWQVVMETLNQELEDIPFAYGPWQDGQNPATAQITTANFEFITPCLDPGSDRPDMLNGVKTWMYQIQALDEDGAVDALRNTEYDMFVIEPGHNFNDFNYDTVSIIHSLKYAPSGKKRLILAYIDIGQAEDYRDYWGADWVAPTSDSNGSPDFLVTVDPDGWSGNYPVAYWQSEWKDIWTDPSGIVAKLALFGFDGIYLDWVEAYDDTKVAAQALQDNVDAGEEMIQFIEEMRQAGENVTENFLVIPQNAPYLIDYDAQRYVSVIDALAVEDTWFHGAGDAEWDDPDAGDLHERHDDLWSTENRLLQYEKYLEQDLPVFSVDYCISTENAEQVYEDAASNDLIPLVTRVSLSRLTQTPPPALSEIIDVLTVASPNAIITANNPVIIYDAGGVNHITIESGAKADVMNAKGNNTITIQSVSSLFTVSRSGAVVTFEGTDDTVLKIPATIDAQTIMFNDQSRSLIINAGKVMLGGQKISLTPSTIN